MHTFFYHELEEIKASLALEILIYLLLFYHINLN